MRSEMIMTVLADYGEVCQKSTALYERKYKAQRAGNEIEVAKCETELAELSVLGRTKSVMIGRLLYAAVRDCRVEIKEVERTKMLHICNKCKGDAELHRNMKSKTVSVICLECGNSGLEAASIDAAIANWNTANTEKHREPGDMRDEYYADLAAGTKAAGDGK